MKNIKKLFVSFLVVIFIVSLTGCGKNTATPAATANFEGEGPVQGGIKSDEEIAALQEEEQQGTTTEYAENVDNTGHEPEAYGSGNFQDYWQGNDYFDLIGYMKDNGFIDAIPQNHRGEIVKDGSTPTCYTFYNDGRTWEITVSGASIRVADKANSIAYYSNIGNDSNPIITIDSAGMQMDANIIQAIDVVVQIIKSNPNESNPLSYTGLEYEKN